MILLLRRTYRDVTAFHLHLHLHLSLHFFLSSLCTLPYAAFVTSFNPIIENLNLDAHSVLLR
jgi:hypothetical protein